MERYVLLMDWISVFDMTGNGPKTCLTALKSKHDRIIGIHGEQPVFQNKDALF